MESFNFILSITSYWCIANAQEFPQFCAKPLITDLHCGRNVLVFEIKEIQKVYEHIGTVGPLITRLHISRVPI